MPCACREKSLIRDDETGTLFCAGCGAAERFDSFEARTYTADGPQGVNIHIGTTGRGSVLAYKDKKIYEANKVIDDITYRLDLSAQRVSEIKCMVSEVTDSDFGDANSNWFPIFVGACVYVCMRRDNKCLAVVEVADVVGCDVHELGRMISRVVDHLGVKLPEFDIVEVFERVVKNVADSRRVEGERAERMREQGVFLVQCAMKWFLTTGRRPLPVVVAVVVLVANVNGEEGVAIEDVARVVHVPVSTCRLRYKELLEVIVKVASSVLPWGKDVTVKNALRNAPFVIRYMEVKSMARERACGETDGAVEAGGFDLEWVVSECLRKDDAYGVEEGDTDAYDSRYLEIGDERGLVEMEKLQLSPECLSVVYNKFLMENGGAKHGGVSTKARGRKRQRGGFELNATEWWNGNSELSKKLLLKQILEKDVGLDTMPPAFVNGCLANQRRREKINAANLRIRRIMCPRDPNSGDDRKVCIYDNAQAQKRKRKPRGKDLDWEDFVIETLLLHRVKEQEIETGQYNTLLGLYVFNSGVN